MKSIGTLILVFSISFHLSSQNYLNNENNNPRSENPFGINLVGGGPALLGSVSVDYYITPTIDIELGAGGSFYGGVKYNIGGNQAHKNWTPYFGIYGTYFWAFVDDDFFGTIDGPVIIYAPIGMQYLSDNGLAFGAEIAVFAASEIVGPTIALKIGYHF